MMTSNHPCWVSWRDAYGLGVVGPWTCNHRTTDGRVTLCGRRVPDDAFDINYTRHPAADDCLVCARALARASGTAASDTE